jgi:hypothetical protein
MMKEEAVWLTEENIMLYLLFSLFNSSVLDMYIHVTCLNRNWHTYLVIIFHSYVIFSHIYKLYF